VIGDFTPRQKTLDYIDSSLHGGVTTMISAGEAHFPGRPKDPAGVKALAAATEAFAAARMNRGIRRALAGQSVDAI
jgi:enamidase